MKKSNDFFYVIFRRSFFAVFLLFAANLHAMNLTNDGFHKGVNLPVIGAPADSVSERDVRLIKSAGFDFVRQPFDIGGDFFKKDDGDIDASVITRLKARIMIMNAGGLRVILDFHPIRVNKRVLREDSEGKRLMRMWMILSRELAGFGDGLAFEVLNEPGALYGGNWWVLQGDIIGAIKSIKEDRVVVASAEGASTIGALVRKKPYEYKGVIYNAHFYDPMMFTHQGADGGGGKYKKYSGTRWPVSYKEGKITGKDIMEDWSGEIVPESKYVWDASKIETKMRSLSDWAEKHSVRVMINEFGVYAKGGVDKLDRISYLKDVVAAFENFHITWAIWQYNAGFGILKDVKTRFPEFDEGILSALGMQKKQ